MKKLVYIISVSFFLASIGCTIKYGFNTPVPLHPSVKTFSVATFASYAPLASPTLSQTFTEALKDIVLNQTSLDLTTRNGNIQYEGSITDYNIRPLAVQGDEIAALNRLTITVNVIYTNELEEEKNFEKSFSRYADYESAQQLSEIEESLIADINEQLVQDIFNQSLGDW